MHNYIRAITLNLNEPERIRWNSTPYWEVTTKFIYNFLFNCTNGKDDTKFWKLNFMARINIFCWKTFNHALPSGHKITKLTRMHLLFDISATVISLKMKCSSLLSVF